MYSKYKEAPPDGHRGNKTKNGTMRMKVLNSTSEKFPEGADM